jgi:hypothetical protein
MFLQAYIKCVNDRKSMNSETGKRTKKKTSQQRNCNTLNEFLVSEDTQVYSRPISCVVKAAFQ